MRFKKGLSYLEPGGHGDGIIMGVSHLLLLGPFYYIAHGTRKLWDTLYYCEKKMFFWGFIQPGPNFTQFWPPIPPASGLLWTFYILRNLLFVHLTKHELSTDYLPITSCPLSYWMTPYGEKIVNLKLFVFSRGQSKGRICKKMFFSITIYSNS